MSGEAIDLLKKMLKSKPEKRITIQQIFDHPWIKNFEIPDK